MAAERPAKVCFVTIGATASFDALIQATLHRSFLSTLQELGYTGLRLQYGQDEQDQHQRSIQALRNEFSPHTEGKLDVMGFDFKRNGLRSDFAAATTGVVISHAGSGSILEALRLSVPLIVVPNPTLLNNHQEELAEEMEHLGYAVHGNLNDLAAALRQAEVLRRNMNQWPPKSSQGDARGLIGVMDDELGFVD